jgi:hypothetical protein
VRPRRRDLPDPGDRRHGKWPASRLPDDLETETRTANRENRMLTSSLSTQPGRRIRARLASLALLVTTGAGSARAEATGQCVEPPDDLVSWWAAENDAADETGTNPANASAAGFAVGHVGSAFDFDGEDDSVAVVAPAGLATQQFTLEGWIETPSLPGPFIGFVAQHSGSTGNFGYELAVSSSTGQVRLTLNGAQGGADLQNVGPDLRDGFFHHVAATYDGVRMHTWVDGVRVGSLRESEAVTYEVGAPFVIGRRPVPLIPEGDWNGRIDELAFYSRALCPAEIRSIFLAGVDGKCTGGVAADCGLFEDDFESGSSHSWTAQSP